MLTRGVSPAPALLLTVGGILMSTYGYMTKSGIDEMTAGFIVGLMAMGCLAILAQLLKRYPALKDFLEGNKKVNIATEPVKKNDKKKGNPKKKGKTSKKKD
ncbi:hypothetical protein AAMO2058_001069500 [Amorphochlora amoebiformis]